MLSWASHLSLGKHMTASAVKIVMLLDVERSGYIECCATSAVLLFLLFFYFATQFQEKIEIKQLCFHLFIYFFCIAVLYSTVCQSRHHDVSWFLVLSHVHRVLLLSRINPDFYTQKSDDISKAKKKKNRHSDKNYNSTFQTWFPFGKFISIYTHSRTGC